jgi:hypothetical protein
LAAAIHGSALISQLVQKRSGSESSLQEPSTYDGYSLVGRNTKPRDDIIAHFNFLSFPPIMMLPLQIPSDAWPTIEGKRICWLASLQHLIPRESCSLYISRECHRHYNISTWIPVVYIQILVGRWVGCNCSRVRHHLPIRSMGSSTNLCVILKSGNTS